MSKGQEVVSRPVLILATIFLSLASLGLIGEVLCRAFFPDSQLRYKSDPEALYFFEPNQKGIQILSNGMPSPMASINGLGLRGADPQEGKGNILILGDSFTFGAGVADEETFVARLHDVLKTQVSVINGGQPGYGLFQMEAALHRLGENLKPELVIAVIWQGDFLRRPPNENERASIRRTQALSRIIKNSVLLTHIYRMVEKAVIVFGAQRAVVHVGEGGKAEASADSYVKGLEDDRPVLVRMNELAKTYGKGLVIVLWPKEGFVSHLPPAEVGLAERLKDSLEKFSRESQIPFISVQPMLQAAKPIEQLVIAGDGHPTPIAHCLVAQTILKAIISFGYAETKQISCPLGKGSHYL
jgi:hypothetical protein